MIWRRKAQHICWTRRDVEWKGDGQSTRVEEHDENVWADVVGATPDVGGHNHGSVNHASEQRIRWKGHFTLSTRLQGGDVGMRYIGMIISNILQSNGYGWASREYLWDTTTKSNVGGIWRNVEDYIHYRGLGTVNSNRIAFRRQYSSNCPWY